MINIKLLLVAAAMTLLCRNVSFAAGWQDDSNGVWYENTDGSYTTNGWQTIDGVSYYFDNDGYRLESSLTPDGYVVGYDGNWIESIPVRAMDGVYFGGTVGTYEKGDGIYIFDGMIEGYDEALIEPDGDWTQGYYTLTEGRFIIDQNTKIIIDSPVSGFAINETDTIRWMDTFLEQKEYWMVLNITTNGQHVESLHGYYSFD